MKIPAKELNLIASTPERECWICEDFLNTPFLISDDYLKNDIGIKEHLRQIIDR